MRYFLLFAYIFFSGGTLALESEIVVEGDEKKVIEAGEIFNGVIRIWPFEGSGESFRKYEGKEFADHFNVQKILEISHNENNFEVLEVKGIFIAVKETSDKSFSLWEFNNVNIPLSLTKLKILPTKIDNGDLFILPTTGAIDKKVNTYAIFIFCILSFVGISGVLFIGKIFLKKKRKKDRYKRSRQALEEISKYSIRDDYEKLYLSIDEDQYYLVSKDSKKNIKNKINEYQYKREWSDNDFESVKKSVCEIVDYELRK